MRLLARAFGGSMAMLALLVVGARAQDSAIGTFTVDGQTTRFRHCA